MKTWSVLKERLRRFPAETDTKAVRALTAKQWLTIARRTDTYLKGYKDRPGSDSRAQRRAAWLAQHGVFSEAKSVLELGCGCGRNLAELRRRYGVRFRVQGYDINPEAVTECYRTMNINASFARLDLYHLFPLDTQPSLQVHDVIFTVGVLGHLEQSAVKQLVEWARQRARQAVVLVEEPGLGTVAKGPRSWNAKKNTGDYVLWLHDYYSMFKSAILTIEDLPMDLQAPAATNLYVLKPT